MKWTLTSLPLVVVGCSFIFLDVADLPGKNVSTGWLFVFGVMYLSASMCAMSANRLARRVAVVAWCPLLLGFPLMTILGIFAIRRLLADPGRDDAIRAQVNAMSPSEIRQLIETRASAELDIPKDQFNVPMERELMVAPVAINNFLDDLHIEYGFPVSSDDRKRDFSVNDIAELVCSRVVKSGVSTQSTVTFVFATDDGSLESFRIQAEAIASAEGVDVEDGVCRFFAENGAELLPVFTTPNKRGSLTVLSGSYVLVPSSDTSLVLLGLVSQIRSYEGIIKSQPELLATLGAHQASVPPN
ncbi:MAG: hypothetical protein JWP89_209 [Schlesneria sp.]|nr:hypothetical protein [Schlesneria sp.]